jgi:hypothetical protein
VAGSSRLTLTRRRTATNYNRNRSTTNNKLVNQASARLKTRSLAVNGVDREVVMVVMVVVVVAVVVVVVRVGRRLSLVRVRTTGVGTRDITAHTLSCTVHVCGAWPVLLRAKRAACLPLLLRRLCLLPLLHDKAVTHRPHLAQRRIASGRSLRAPAVLLPRSGNESGKVSGQASSGITVM